VSATELDQRTEEARLPSALAAAQEPLDGLALLCQVGAEDGLECWLLAAESDLWHGYLFSRVPVDGSMIQSHMRSLAERYRQRVPQALTRAAPSGLFPVQSSYEESGAVAHTWPAWRDFDLVLAQETIGILRVGVLDESAAPNWDRARRLCALAVPYLAYLLTHCQDTGQALLDPVTGVYSRAYFHDQLSREVRRAATYCCELSLIVVQVVPPAREGQVTTRALKQCARLLSDNTRRTDICGRLGPARFGILLPHTGARNALMAAARLEELVAQDCEVSRSCALRIGISGWNLQGPDERELIDQANEAARMAADGQGGPFLYV